MFPKVDRLRVPRQVYFEILSAARTTTFQYREGDNWKPESIATDSVNRIMDLGWIIGRAKTSFVHAKEPITLSTKSGKSRSLLEICEASTPPCNLNPLLFNGHLQTFMTVVKGVDVPIYYKRKVFEAEDPVYAGTYTVDFVVSPYEGSEEGLFPRTTHYTEEEFKDIGSLDSKPMLVALHGLSGGSHEIYLRHCLAPLIEGETGWEGEYLLYKRCYKSDIS